MQTAAHEEFDLVEKPAHQADDVRAAFPAAAALVDATKAAFGEDCKVVYTEEKGVVVKAKNYKADADYGGSVNATEFIRMGQHSRDNAAMVEARSKGGVHGRTK